MKETKIETRKKNSSMRFSFLKSVQETFCRKPDDEV